MKFIYIILLLTSTYSFSQDVQIIKEKEIDDSRVSSPVLIERAYAKKEIDLNKRVLYLAYYLYDYSKVPDKYKSNAPEKCGTWIASIIFNNYTKLNKVTKEAVDVLEIKRE